MSANLSALPQAAPLLRVPDVSREYSLSREYLHKRRRLKLGPPFVRIARNLVLYKRADLEQFIDAHRVQPDGGA